MRWLPHLLRCYNLTNPRFQARPMYRPAAMRNLHNGTRQEYRSRFKL